VGAAPDDQFEPVIQRLLPPAPDHVWAVDSRPDVVAMRTAATIAKNFQNTDRAIIARLLDYGLPAY
jgi:hypothetical protein